MSPHRSTDVVQALEAVRSEAELPKIRSRLAADEPAMGMAMRDLFATAKAHADLPLTEVDRLLDHPAYEPRMAAFCILDFQVRRRLDDDGRRDRCRLYLDRHDRITTWDMVDRAASRVVGGYLAGRDPAPLRALAASSDPLRRRTAATAPLAWVMSGTDADLAAGLDLAGPLAADPDPVVHKAVGILLKHAGGRDPAAVEAFLDAHAAEMARPAVRLAVDKLPSAVRGRFVG